jgi:hypothetical protein
MPQKGFGAHTTFDGAIPFFETRRIQQSARSCEASAAMLLTGSAFTHSRLMVRTNRTLCSYRDLEVEVIARVDEVLELRILAFLRGLLVSVLGRRLARGKIDARNCLFCHA